MTVLISIVLNQFENCCFFWMFWSFLIFLNYYTTSFKEKSRRENNEIRGLVWLYVTSRRLSEYCSLFKLFPRPAPPTCYFIFRIRKSMLQKGFSWNCGRMLKNLVLRNNNKLGLSLWVVISIRWFRSQIQLQEERSGGAIEIKRFIKIFTQFHVLGGRDEWLQTVCSWLKWLSWVNDSRVAELICFFRRWPIQRMKRKSWMGTRSVVYGVVWKRYWRWMVKLVSNKVIFWSRVRK